MAKDKITAYFLRVSEDGETIYEGYLGEIEDTLKAKQDYVNFGKEGGLIQCVSLTDEIDVICNDEGKLLNFPPNRAWLYKGRMADIFCGNILCVRHEGDMFTSIRKEDVPVVEGILKPICGGGMLAKWEDSFETADKTGESQG